MKIQRLSIRNLRSINQLEWRLPDGQLAGWHVILGDNGAGKSSFLRALALCLVGPREAIAARQEWQEWVGGDGGIARLVVEVVRDSSFDSFSKAGRTGVQKTLYAGLVLRKSNEAGTLGRIRFTNSLAAERHIWGTGSGWFSAAYGPFRRFSGGDKDTERIFLSNPKLGAHISVFGENVALTESLLWLRELHYKRLEHDWEGGLIDRLKSFINQPDFLPHGIQFQEVSTKGVEFIDANGNITSIENLSDGYRSILSMTFELIRQLCRVYPWYKVFNDNNTKVVATGVVLIDEIDAHLHPTWQKRIGFWLTEHFPEIQFIVTTHSPLVCQAAINGSIFQLRAPGSEDESHMLDGRDRDRLLYGDVLEAYSTGAFGISQTRSVEANDKQERLAELNNKEAFVGLSAAEELEQATLRSIFATTANETEAMLVANDRAS